MPRIPSISLAARRVARRRLGGLVGAVAAWMLMVASAAAWEARLGVVCELAHEGPDGSVLLTYDPRIPEYTISITRNGAWVSSPVFAMRFEGPREIFISTDQHVISEDRATLTVADSGFGNVLNGLEFNVAATALLGEQSATFSLDGAAPAVRAFRACDDGLSV